MTGTAPRKIDLHRADAYGRSFADIYDTWYDGVTDAGATARFMADRCGRGPVVELGVGRGRLARALTGAGVDVIGLDGSAAMLEHCPTAGRSPAGDRKISRLRADMRALPLTGPVRGVLIAFNTLFNLTVEGEQSRLLADVGRLLAPSGVLVVEALAAGSLAAGPAASVGVRHRTADHVVVSAARVDRRAQTVTGQHLEITAGGVVLRPWILRWLTPAQLDGLAAAAGLALVERFGDWHGRPFDDASETHVSVYRPIG